MILGSKVENLTEKKKKKELLLNDQDWSIVYYGCVHALCTHQIGLQILDLLGCQFLLCIWMLKWNQSIGFLQVSRAIAFCFMQNFSLYSLDMEEYRESILVNWNDIILVNTIISGVGFIFWNDSIPRDEICERRWNGSIPLSWFYSKMNLWPEGTIEAFHFLGMSQYALD